MYFCVHSCSARFGYLCLHGDAASLGMNKTGSLKQTWRSCCAQRLAAAAALLTKDNWRQKNVHTVERSWAIIHRGLAARNKCPYVIDYTLQANEIKRAWIDSDESYERDVRSRVQWLHWHAHIQRASEEDQSVLWVANTALCTDLLHPPLQSGSVLLKSNESNRIWQAGDLLLRHHCWENLSFVKDKQHPGCEARKLTLETHSSSAFRWRKCNWAINGLLYYFNWSFRPVQ